MRILFPVLLCSLLLFPHRVIPGEKNGPKKTIENPYELNIPLIRQKLKPGQAIARYTLQKDNVYILFIGKNTACYRKLGIRTPGLVRLVNRLTEPLDDFTRGKVDYLRIHYDLSLARQLYDVLLRDILAQGKKKQDIRELFIIPDRELFKLPFEALVTGFNQQDLDPGTIFSEYAAANYLIRDYAVSYFLSPADVLGKTPAPGKTIKKYTITAFGGPTIRKIKGATGTGIKGGVDFSRGIPAARKEILGIASIFGNTGGRIFLADLFNKKNFENFAPRSRIIHIATHFVNNLDNPADSALVFSSLHGDTPFDYYYAHDIFKLELDADLVVLSACESAEKHLQGLQSRGGIMASLKKAGARAVIAGMWPVDEYSSQLVPFFYRHYRVGYPTAPALRSAKLQFMKETAVIVKGLKISFAHPFLWANYILYQFSL